MPQQKQIKIHKASGGSTVVFDPANLEVQVLTQIFWTNNDSNAHWPGLVETDGSINKTFFMPNQIAGGGDTSAVFSPSLAGTLNYACSLHPTEKGTIKVT